jgi:hypothetical protein
MTVSKSPSHSFTGFAIPTKSSRPKPPMWWILHRWLCMPICLATHCGSRER